VNSTAAKPANATSDATSDAAANVAASSPSSDDPTAVIDTLRGQIDALDTAIGRLIAERAQLSRRIQTARVNAGGTRIELGRERAILDHYRTALGPAGPAVADAVLRACRGAR
jgi:chorismate mutase